MTVVYAASGVPQAEAAPRSVAADATVEANLILTEELAGRGQVFSFGKNRVSVSMADTAEQG
jgi:hypothetical protein